jgi:hypothetical protein
MHKCPCSDGLQAPQSGFGSQTPDLYLHIKIEKNVPLSLSRNYSNTLENETVLGGLEEGGLSLDLQSISATDSQTFENIITDSLEIRSDVINCAFDINLKSSQLCRYNGCIDIILHPIYQVPSPYIHLFDSNGQPASTSLIQSLVDDYIRKKNTTLMMGKKHNNKRNGINNSGGDCEFIDEDNCDIDGGGGVGLEGNINEGHKNSCDNSYTSSTKSSKDIMYIQEEHPYLLIPCTCLHVCGLGDIFTSLDLDVKLQNKHADLLLSPPPFITNIKGPQRLNPVSLNTSKINSVLSNEDVLDVTSTIDTAIYVTERNEFERDQNQIKTGEQIKRNVSKARTGDLYLLHWFTLVGASIGISITPSFYISAVNFLQNMQK